MKVLLDLPDDGQRRRIRAESEGPEDRDHHFPRQIESARRPVAAPVSLPLDHAPNPAWRSDSRRRIELVSRPQPVRVKHGTSRGGKAVHYYLNFSGQAQTLPYPHAGGEDVLKGKAVEKGAAVEER